MISRMPSKLEKSLAFVQKTAFDVVFWFALTAGLGESILDCKNINSPQDVVEAGVDIVDTTCQTLEGITSNSTVITACATASEIATIASYISKFMYRLPAEAGVTMCTSLGNTGVCATPEEIGPGLQLILEKRRMLMVNQ